MGEGNREILMMVCGGNVIEAEELKKMPVKVFLKKFDYFCKAMQRENAK